MDSNASLESAGLELADDAEVQTNQVMHLIAPIAAIAVTMLVRKALNATYEKSTGRSAPLPRDPQVPLMRAIVWTAVITTTAAVAEVAVYRLVSKIGARRT